MINKTECVKALCLLLREQFMNIEKLIKDISNDADIHFHSFDQVNDTIIAKSHFFDIHFGPNRVDVVFDYPVPGPKLLNYSIERLPFYLDYNEEKFYDILIEVLDDLQTKFIALEYKDEIENE